MAARPVLLKVLPLSDLEKVKESSKNDPCLTFGAIPKGSDDLK
jgi:hypothetical protein